MNFRTIAGQPAAILLTAFVMAIFGGSVLAQNFPGPPRGQGGGAFGPRGNRGILRELAQETVRAELQITPEQQLELDALTAAQQDNRDQFTDIFQRYAAATSEEERTQVRQQMRERFVELRKKADADAKAILTPTQRVRIEQLQLHHEGPGIFVWNEELASDFGITEEQKKELASLGEQRMMARFALGRADSEEDRQQLDDEWSAKFLTIFTPEQKAKWEERIGPPPVVTHVPEKADAAVPDQPAHPLADATEPPRVVTLQPNQNPSTASGSFHAEADASATAGPRNGESGPKKLSFNFRFAPWGDVLRLFAEEANLSLDLNAIPPGTFNYYDRSEYTPAEALDILNGYLLPKGFCLLRRDDFLVCVNIDDPISPNLIPNVSPDDLDQRGKNELLTVIFPLEGVDVSQIAVEVNEIKGPQGKVVGLKSTNSILVTDIGANLRRIRDLLRDVTARGGPNDITFKSYQIQHIDVADAEHIVRTLLGVTPSVTNVSAMNDPRSSGRDPRDPRSQPAPQPAPRADNSPVRVTIDPRTNQLLVTATLAQHLLIEQALKTIDLEGDASKFSPSSNRPSLRVYQVTSADAREVTKTIDSLMPGIVVNEDARNGKIHIQATPDQHRQVESLIAQMDGLGGARQMAVIPLTRLDPGSVTTTLRSMFLKDGDTAPIIEADYYGQQLMIRANADQLTQIRTLLTQLGEDGTGKRSANLSGTRTIQLGGRDPAEILPLIERMWKANNGAPIHVISPAVPAPSERALPAMPNQPRGNVPPQTNSTRSPGGNHKIPVLTVAQTREPASSSDSKSTPEQTPGQKGEKQPAAEPASADQLLDEYLKSQKPAESPAGATAAVPGELNIVVTGDELFITSSDPELLNQFEEMLQRTLQAVPPRTTWNVYTLKVADATEAANMLKLLFPGTTVAAASSSSGGMMDTLTSGATSLGSSLRDLTGLGAIGGVQSLRIIPDNRLNALFIAGPAAQVREVEEMLKVLDATDLGGDSLRDKLARMIAVRHASVSEVYDIVKDVYKTYIDPPKVQENNNNPFAMLAAGGRGGRGNEAAVAPAPKLAIGVDKTTSHLIVWADDALFQEVESLVQSIDQASLEARRTVRVVNLENTNSAVIQGALGSLMPQVKVSVTGSRQTAAPSSSSLPTPSPSSSSRPSGGSDNSDQMRQFFEQRMRERMQGGGGFGGPGGGFGGPGGPGGFSGRGGFGGGNRGSDGRGR